MIHRHNKPLEHHSLCKLPSGVLLEWCSRGLEALPELRRQAVMKRAVREARDHNKGVLPLLFARFRKTPEQMIEMWEAMYDQRGDLPLGDFFKVAPYLLALDTYEDEEKVVRELSAMACASPGEHVWVSRADWRALSCLTQKKPAVELYAAQRARL
jgi:hypothetical protein